MERSSWIRALIILLVIIASLYLIEHIYSIAISFADIIVLFFLAWLVSFTLRPLANSIQQLLRIPFPLAVSSVYLSLVLLLIVGLLIIVPVIVAQIFDLIAHSQEYSANIAGWVIYVQNLIQTSLKERGIQGVDLTSIFNPGDVFRQVQSLFSSLLTNTGIIISTIGTSFFNTLLVLILSYYMMLDGDRFAANVISLVPERYQQEMLYFMESVDRTFGGFMRGQLIQGLIYGTGTWIIMSIFNLNFAIVVGLAAGLSLLIPFIGPFLSMIPPLIIALLAYQNNLINVLWVFLLLLALQWVVMYFIAPKVMSDSVGIHPVMVFLGLLVGARVAGILGAIFGVPIVAVIYAMAIFFYNSNPQLRRRREQKLAELLARTPSAHRGHPAEQAVMAGESPAPAQPQNKPAEQPSTILGRRVRSGFESLARSTRERLAHPSNPENAPEKAGPNLPNSKE